jgi:hypothetical protein
MTKGNTVVIQKKKKTFRDIIDDYKLGVQLVFSNFSAVLVLIGFFCK